MLRKNRGKPEWQKRIALERIGVFFDRAEKGFEKHPERSTRYIKLARKIGERYNIRIPREFRRRFCKKCNSFLVPGKNCTVRARGKQGAVIVKCGVCGNVMRYPYKGGTVLKY